MKYICNPLNIDYRYQFNLDQRTGSMQNCREAADPSMILFQGKYYIFASMNLKVWVSEDMVHWESYFLPDNLPLYDYAPDVRVMGDYVYFSASKRGEICNFYRTKDVIHGPYEEIPGTFDFWDPNLFIDDDGRVYFYWGCDAMTPIHGVELDPETMHQKGKVHDLIAGDANVKGYERVGENNSKFPKTDEEIEAAYRQMMKMQGMDPDHLPPQASVYESAIKGMLSDRPFIEGAWMTKHDGKYYLQYAFAGTQYSSYGDGVYVSDSPLGTFTPAENNPYSYKPGGFLPGAGHGSTMEDKGGNWWHTATMRISKNHNFERRVGLWKAGFDADGELFCDQNYGDWPFAVDDMEKMEPWQEPEWMLLSYGKTMCASSATEGKGPELAADENVQTWWQAAGAEAGEWIQMDLGKEMDVRAIQVNFADDDLNQIPCPGEIHPGTQARYIDETVYHTRWILEGSLDGQEFFTIEDKSRVETDLPHDLVVREEGLTVRYLKLTIMEVPYGQKPCISGLRVFGNCEGAAPGAVSFDALRDANGVDMNVTMQAEGARGYNILWGHTPEKLYHSFLTYDATQRVGALVKGKNYYVRVDAFNECGITQGQVVKEV
jgi:hypothetical protein